MRLLGLKLVGLGFLVLLGFGLIWNTTYMISAGHAGVVFNKMDGGIQQETLDQGWHVVAPWKRVTEYPVSTELAYYIDGTHEDRKDVDDSIVIGTKDGKTIKVDAQAKRIQADAEAYYNALVASSLTPEMVQLKQVEKWDGKLPTYSGITNGLLNLK